MKKKSFKLIFSIYLFLISVHLFFSTSFAAVLHWDSVESTQGCVVAGYKVYYGTSYGQYTHTIDVGDVTSYDLKFLDLIPTQIYFFAVSAYSATDQNGLLSAPVYYTSQNNDADNDGMLDDWESNYGITSAFLDPDSDNLYNRLEYYFGTNPIDSDSDDDGIPDGIEVHNGLNPLLPDTSEISDIQQSPDVFISGVDPEYYLNKKLAALQALNPAWFGIDAASLEFILLRYGFTAQTHYSQHGYKEGLEPNQYFNHSEYILAKATAMYNSGLYPSVLEAQNIFNDAWPHDAYLHYIQYGAAEGINPSNNFDESAYLADKLMALKAGGSDWDNKTIDDLRILLVSYGLTIVDHYLLYGQYDGLTPSPVFLMP